MFVQKGFLLQYLRPWAYYHSIGRKLRPLRLFNALQVLLSFYLSRLLRRPLHWGMPIGLSVEPTTSCNLRCPECPSGLRSFTRPTGMLDEQLFGQLLAQIAPRTLHLTFYFQGEPYLHPRFLPMVAQAHAQGLITSTSTNAHYLSAEKARQTVDSGLDRLIISVDGTTQDTYASYRVGGSLEKVLEGTRHILEARQQAGSCTPKVVWQFLVVAPNEHQVPEVLALGRQLGVDEVVLKTAQLYDYAQGSPLMPQQERYRRYRRLPDGTYALKNRMDDHCWRMWSGCVITWDGKVVPCCFDKDAAHTLGQLPERSLEQIWKGDAYRRFRGAVLKSRKDIDICKNCTEGTQVFADH